MSINNLWIERYRPSTLDEIVLSKDDREFFESLADSQEIPHLLFAGVQGTGKTSLAKILINDVLKCEYLFINASDENSIDVIRSKVTGFAKTKSFDGKIKIVLLDESDSISLEGMKCLRSTMEEFSATCRFILTCNYLHKIILPIQSRCVIINLTPPIEKILQRVKFILQSENITIPEDQKPLLLKHVKENLPDLRRIINDIQRYSVSGTLDIKSNSCSDFASNIVSKILAKDNVMKLRKEIIENEKAFSNDYHHLLKLIFEELFNSSLNYEEKGDLLLIASRGLEQHVFAIDKEINFFSTILSISRGIGTYRS